MQRCTFEYGGGINTHTHTRKLCFKLSRKKEETPLSFSLFIFMISLILFLYLSLALQFLTLLPSLIFMLFFYSVHSWKKLLLHKHVNTIYMKKTNSNQNNLSVELRKGKEIAMFNIFFCKFMKKICLAISHPHAPYSHIKQFHSFFSQRKKIFVQSIATQQHIL